MLPFNFKKAHIAGSINTTADFFYGLELKVTEKIRLKILENIQTTSIDLTTSSMDVADAEQFFSQVDDKIETKVPTLVGKEQYWYNAKEWVANEELSSPKTIVKGFKEIDWNSTSYSMNGIKANAQIWVQQDVNLDLRNLKLKN